MGRKQTDSQQFDSKSETNGKSGAKPKSKKTKEISERPVEAKAKNTPAATKAEPGAVKTTGNGGEMKAAASQSTAAQSGGSKTAAGSQTSTRRTTKRTAEADGIEKQYTDGSTKERSGETKFFARSASRAAIPAEAIAVRAWSIWQEEGCPEGRDLEHWLRAESELANSQ